MMKYTIPKGTFDVLPEEPKAQEKWKEVERWQYVEETAKKLSYNYGYQEIRTPIFEKTELFVRGMGETSDVISKEMYTFTDKGGRLMSLRPEGTASVMRAFIENGLRQLGSYHKFFYIGPFFRYDRPQAGRFRQFHQFGVEAIGNPEPEQDFEVIDMLLELYKRLGLKNLSLFLNTLGNKASREEYKKRLLAYLKPFFGDLTVESQNRFTKNPLRILDSKNPKEQALLKDAPTILETLDKESENHFTKVCELLKTQNISFKINSKLVRGLDYYNKTVFEVTSDVLGAQNSIGGGGRYDDLMASLGGPDLPAIGYSVGMERILYTMQKQEASFPTPKGPFIVFLPLSRVAEELVRPFLYALRHKKIPTEMIIAKKIQKALQLASDLHASFSVIIGEEELKKGVVQLKNMKTRGAEEIPFSSLQEHLTQKFKESYV
jgi:histidyl-tRNA synthetase